MRIHACAYMCCGSRYITASPQPHAWRISISKPQFAQIAQIGRNCSSARSVHRHAAQGNCIHRECSVLARCLYSLVILFDFYTMLAEVGLSAPSLASSTLLAHYPFLSCSFLVLLLVYFFLANRELDRGSDSASAFGSSPPSAPRLPRPRPRPYPCPCPCPGGFPFLPPLPSPVQLRIFVHDQYFSIISGSVC